MADDVRTLTLGSVAIRDAAVPLEGEPPAPRRLAGIAVPWSALTDPGATAEYGAASESFARGAFRDALRAMGDHPIPFIDRHNGTTVAAVRATETPDGLRFEGDLIPDDPTAQAYARRVAAGIDGVSVEFVPGEITRTAGRVVHRSVRRLVAIAGSYGPAYETARVALRDQAATAAPRRTRAMPTYAETMTTRRTELEARRDAIADLAAAEARELAADELAERDSIVSSLGRIDASLAERSERDARLAAERTAAVQTTEAATQRPHIGVWAHAALGALDGDRAAQRALADIVTGDAPGVVPPAYLSEVVGIIDASRPFLSSTRRLPTPEVGLKLIVPIITSRPVTDVQLAEKTDIASAKATVGTTEYGATTVAGGGDLSIQLLRRSSPSYLTLYMDLLAEAYAQDAEALGLQTLLGAVGVQDGGTLDPTDPGWRAIAFANTAAAVRKGPDTIWLNNDGMGAFLAAKDSTGRPLYPSLGPVNALGTASAGSDQPVGSIDGMRAVYVPDSAQAAITGWSRGMAWAEDGTFTLTADVPSKLGRDVALAGILWFAPLYPAAFTKWAVAAPVGTASKTTTKAA